MRGNVNANVSEKLTIDFYRKFLLVSLFLHPILEIKYVY